MLPDDAKIISVDDHVIEHRRVWLDRVPAKYAEVAPRIVKLPDGNDTWLYEGGQSGRVLLSSMSNSRSKPMVFSTANSPNRSRTDWAMPWAVSSRIMNSPAAATYAAAGRVSA